MRSLVLIPADGGPDCIVNSFPATVGRNDFNAVLIEDDRVSEAHATFFEACLRVFVLDHGSKNGTRLGEITVTPGRLYELFDRQAISFGGAVFTVELSSIDLAGGTRTRFGAIMENDCISPPESAGPVLIFLNGPMAGRCEPVEFWTSNYFSIGRGELCDLKIGDPAASLTHCELEKTGCDIRVRDLASKNGTLVNGGNIRRPVPVCDRDVITVGTTLLMYIDPAPCVPGTGSSTPRLDGGGGRDRIGWIYAGLMLTGTAFSVAILYSVLR